MYKAIRLKYDYNFLEPIISSRTLTIHYNNHYLNYLKKLNDVLIRNNYDFRYTKEQLFDHIDEFPLSDRDDILFNLGGVVNHELYFNNMGKKELKGKLKDKINNQYGSFDKFKDEFINKTKLLVGSGYTSLVIDKNKDLNIINFSNQESAYIYGYIPILTIDLWEHSYYLDYQSNRNLYIDNFFEIIDFEYVNNLYEKNI